MNQMKIFLLVAFIFQAACSVSKTDSAPTNHTSDQVAKVETVEPDPVSTSVPVSNHGLHFLKTLNGRAMAYDYKPGTKPTVWLLIHGLMDEMSKLQELANLAQKDGHGVLQVDLQGHGETLKMSLKTQAELPLEFKYQDNVEDLQLLLAYLQIEDLVIVGHSYGGGIAYALAASLEPEHTIHVQSVHLLAPYVQRIDKFLLNQISNRNPFMDWTKITASSQRKMKLQGVSDQLMDPWLDQIMAKHYREYLTAEMKKNKPVLTDADKADIEVQVQVAIRVTKGIRSFDLLDSSLPLLKVTVPLQIIGGSKDSLVVPAQLKELNRRLEKEQVAHELLFMEGEMSGHLFPRLMPDSVYQKIIQFQR